MNPGLRKFPLVFALISCSLLLSLLTVSLQVLTLGLPYLEGTQMERHLKILHRQAGDPYQYRILSEYLIAGYRFILKYFGLSQSITVALITFRVVQNTLIFFFAAAYYRKLGLNVSTAILGLALLAWGMTHCFYDSDLAFNTYSDVIFYLLAAVLILNEQYAWMIPLTALAALNRETSGLIPFLMLAPALARKSLPARKIMFFAIAALFAYICVFTGLRFFFAPQSLYFPYGHHQGWELFGYNVYRWTTWLQLFATFNVLPFLTLFAFRRLPGTLQLFFWIIAPVWFLIHVFGSIMAETRLFIVPLALLFVPGALLGILPAPKKVEAEEP
jgi:hypothetical protein